MTAPFIRDIYSGTHEATWDALGHTKGSINISLMGQRETGRREAQTLGLSASHLTHSRVPEGHAKVTP